MQINSYATATTSANIVFDTAYGFASGTLAFGSAASTAQLYLRQFVSGVSGLTSISVPSGSTILKIAANGTRSTQAGPTTVSVYHYTRWTGTFTAPLLAYVSVSLFRHRESSLLKKWLLETEHTVEGKVAREYKSQEQKEPFEVWGPKRHSELCGTGYDHLVERLKIFEALFERPEIKETKVEAKTDRSESWFLPRSSKTSSMK
jgi:hypothetical protein